MLRRHLLLLPVAILMVQGLRLVAACGGASRATRVLHKKVGKIHLEYDSPRGVLYDLAETAKEPPQIKLNNLHGLGVRYVCAPCRGVSRSAVDADAAPQRTATSAGRCPGSAFVGIRWGVRRGQGNGDCARHDSPRVGGDQESKVDIHGGSAQGPRGWPEANR